MYVLWYIPVHVLCAAVGYFLLRRSWIKVVGRYTNSDRAFMLWVAFCFGPVLLLSEAGRLTVDVISRWLKVDWNAEAKW